MPAGNNSIKLMNERIFACFYQDSIKIGELHHLAISFTNSRSDIAKIGKCFDSEEEIRNNEPFGVFTLFRDNSAMIQNPSQGGRTISTIYPPPTAKEVMVIQYCMSLKRMFILLTSGTLCIYKIDKDTAILEKLQYPN